MALIEKLSAIGDAIRNKTGGTEALTLDQMVTEIEGIQAGGGGSTEEWFNDGDTHIWITLPEGRTSPMLGCYPNGTVTVDWGDGTEPDVLTGINTYTAKWTPTHNYAKPGDYVIKLSVDGEVVFGGSSSSDQYSYILRHSTSTDKRNRAYQNAVQKIEMGNDTKIGNYAFCYCSSLSAITISGSVTSIGQYAFQYCYALASVTIPEGVTSIDNVAFSGCSALSAITIPDSVTSLGSSVFQNCYALASVTIPEGVTSIGGSTFSNCYCVRFYDFSNHTAVPTLSATNAFTGIATDCEIRVPSALYDEWIAATNWSTYASQIVAV